MADSQLTFPVLLTVLNPLVNFTDMGSLDRSHGVAHHIGNV